MHQRDIGSISCIWSTVRHGNKPSAGECAGSSWLPARAGHANEASVCAHACIRTCMHHDIDFHLIICLDDPTVHLGVNLKHQCLANDVMRQPWSGEHSPNCCLTRLRLSRALGATQPLADALTRGRCPVVYLSARC